MPSSEKQSDERRPHQTPPQTSHRNLPCLLLLPRARKDSHHDPHHVHTTADIKQLEHKVPQAEQGGCPEEVQVAGYEDEEVEHLGEQGDAFGAAVAVDGGYEGQFGGCVGEVAEEAEDVEVDGHDGRWGGGDRWGGRVWVPPRKREDGVGGAWTVTWELY